MNNVMTMATICGRFLLLLLVLSEVAGAAWVVGSADLIERPGLSRNFTLEKRVEWAAAVDLLPPDSSVLGDKIIIPFNPDFDQSRIESGLREMGISGKIKLENKNLIAASQVELGRVFVAAGAAGTSVRKATLSVLDVNVVEDSAKVEVELGHGPAARVTALNKYVVDSPNVIVKFNRAFYAKNPSDRNAKNGAQYEAIDPTDSTKTFIIRGYFTEGMEQTIANFTPDNLTVRTNPKINPLVHQGSEIYGTFKMQAGKLTASDLRGIIARSISGRCAGNFNY